MFNRNQCARGKHAWGPWLQDIDIPCQLVRYCDRCHTKEIGVTKHSFFPWRRTVSSGTCIELRSCRVCLEQEERPADHAWVDWAFESDTSCVQVRQCLDCQTAEARPPEHHWGEWELREGARRARACERCGTTEIEVIEEPLVVDTSMDDRSSPGAPLLIIEDTLPMEELVELSSNDPIRTEVSTDTDWNETSDYATWPETSAMEQAVEVALVEAEFDRSIETEAESPDLPQKLEPIVMSSQDMAAEPTDHVPTAAVDSTSSSVEMAPAAQHMEALEEEPPAPEATLADAFDQLVVEALKDIDGVEVCEVHVWGEWQYEAENVCRLIRVCDVCRQQDSMTLRGQHQLAWVQATPPDSQCLWRHQCSRCGHVEQVENRHRYHWTTRNDDPCTRELKCEDCGLITESQTAHSWFLSARSENNTEHYVCEICFKTMVR